MTTWLEKLRPLSGEFRTLTLPNSPAIEAAEKAMDLGARLDGCKKHIARNIRRETKDLRQKAAALKHLAGLPAAGEGWHCWIDGTYSLWDLIPAIVELIHPATIAELHVATLSFSQGNVASMLELLDAGKIGAMTLLCSHYFSATSKEIYDDAAVGFASRGQRFSSCRTHAKVMAIRLSDGLRFALESSANLRSCKNAEVFSLIHDADLYDFHRSCIEELAQ
jgi:hypothetical protein